MTILLVVTVLVIVFGLSADPSHPKLVVSSNDYHNSQEYLSFIKQELNNPLNNSKLTFASADLKRAIEAKFPEVTNVDVELPLLSRDPVVRLDISRPAILLEAQNSSSMIVSEQGRLIGLAADYKRPDGLIEVSDQSGVVDSEGSQLFSAQQVGFLETVAGQVTGRSLRESFSLPATAQEADLHVIGQIYLVKMDMGGDALEQAGAFLAARHYFLSHHQNPTQYLDVRVAGKVFFK